jgi:hypothetical protein
MAKSKTGTISVIVDRTLDAQTSRGSRSSSRGRRSNKAKPDIYWYREDGARTGFGGGGSGGGGFRTVNPFHKGSTLRSPESGGLIERIKGHVVDHVKVDIVELSSAINDMVSKFETGLLEDDPTKPYHIDGVDLNLAVNGTGGIELIGKVSVEVQTGITVHIKRKDSPASKSGG